MNWSSASIQNLKRWFRVLMHNRYFWGGLAALMLTLAVLYILFNHFLMPAYTRHDVSVTVPDVTSHTFSEAREILQQKSLQAERQQAQRFNPNVPQNEVVDQNPPPDAPVKPGRRIYLTVNEGQTPVVRLPSLEGTSIREAKNRLQALGLTVGEVQPDSIPAPYPNTITGQSPAPGDSIRKGSEVDLWFSRGIGEAMATVPDVTGLTLQAARDTLLSRRLRFVIVDAPADSALADSLQVQAQNRPAGTQVREGTELRLFTRPESPTNSGNQEP